MSKSPKRLGRGMSSLISAGLAENEEPGGTVDIGPPQPTVLQSRQTRSRILSIPVEKIRPNPTQPRHVFDKTGLEALAASLKDCGALQPILVRPSGTEYEVVAGERRLRAAKIAGLAEIPAIIKSIPDDRLLELALIENVQRADLNPIERARGYRTLHDSHGLSHDQIAKKMGEDRATVTNYLRLLSLCDDALAMIAGGSLSTGHGKALLAVSDPMAQSKAASTAAKEGWSVRRLEASIRTARSPDDRPKKTDGRRPAVQDMEQRLSAALGVRVTVKEGRKRHSGKITIEYYSLDDFERFVSLLGVSQESPS